MGKGKRNKENNNEVISAKMAKKRTDSTFSPAVIATICVAALVIIGVFVWGITSNMAKDPANKTAMQINDTKINGTEFTYNYNSQALNFQNTYSSYLSMFGVDFSKPLDEQKYSDDETWADYFREAAKTTLIETTLLYNEATKKGLSLTDEEKNTLKTEMDSLKAYLAQLGYGADAYLESAYGEGVTLSRYNEYILKSSLANKFRNEKIAEFEYTKEDYEKYYEENKQSMDDASFRSYRFEYTVPTATVDSETGETVEPDATDESYKDEARASADTMLAALTDENSFEGYIFENILTAEQKESEAFAPDFTLTEAGAYASVATAVGDWLFDSARVEGDTAVIEANNSFFVLYFKSCGLDRYETANIRHIFISPETVADVYLEDGTTVDETATNAAKAVATEEARTEAQKVYDEWKNGDATEESFGSLAATYSDDDVAAADGLIENVTKTYFNTAEVTDWIYGARTAGDCEIVESTYGFHIIYFIGNGEPAWELEVDQELVSDAYAAYVDELEAASTITTNDEFIASVS